MKHCRSARSIISVGRTCRLQVAKSFERKTMRLTDDVVRRRDPSTMDGKEGNGDGNEDGNRHESRDGGRNGTGKGDANGEEGGRAIQPGYLRSGDKDRSEDARQRET